MVYFTVILTIAMPYSMKKTILFLLLIFPCLSFAQSLPFSRSIDWTNTGVQGGIPCVSTIYDVTTTTPTLVGDGVTDNKANLQSLLNNTSTYPSPCVFYFPAGTYFFSEMISMVGGRVLRGASPASTTFNFKFGLSGTDNPCIETIVYNYGSAISITSGATKGSIALIVSSASSFAAGDWAEMYETNPCSTGQAMYTQNPSDGCTISWAANAIGQMFKITSISDDTLFLDRPLRIDFTAPAGGLVVRSVGMLENVGFENFKIVKQDTASTNNNAYTFQFKNAANCWIRNIESDSTYKGHVWIEQCSNMEVRDSYFSQSFTYGSSGEGYGVMLGQHVGSCLVENNIFNHLRHGMLSKQGANGNVFGYNYAINAYWSDESGVPPAITAHGQYPFENLFEGNIVQRITMADYWGPCGPGNTFLRNRVTEYDLAIQDNSNDENLIANELTGGTNIIDTSGFGSPIANSYGTFEDGNNINGTITYDTIYGTTLANSYYLSSTPVFWDGNPWPSIGPEFTLGSGTIPAQNRYNANTPLLPLSGCPVSVTGIIPTNNRDNIIIFPNPVVDKVTIQAKTPIIHMTITDITGRLLSTIIYTTNQLDLSFLERGIYIMNINAINGQQESIKLVKL